MTYDAARSHRGAVHAGATWEWDGAEWNQRTPTTVPQISDQASMVYDSARPASAAVRRVHSGTHTRVGVGRGQLGGFDLSPPRREPLLDHAVAYNSGRRKTVMLGTTTTMLSQTWECDGGDWHQITLDLQPLPHVPRDGVRCPTREGGVVMAVTASQREHPCLTPGSTTPGAGLSMQ